MQDRATRKQFMLLQIVVLLSFFALSMPLPILMKYFLAEKIDYFGLPANSILFIALGLYPLGGFLATPFLGAISDRIGRKKVLLLCLFFSGFLQCASGFSIYQEHVTLFLIFRFLLGVFEGNSSIAYSSVSDMADGSERKKYFGRINAALTLGWVIGPVFGGLFLSGNLAVLGYALPFYLSALFLFVAFLALFFHFKETCIGRHRRIHSKFSLKENQGILKLLFSAILIALSIDAMYQLLPIYLGEVHLLSALELGAIISIISFSKILGNVYLINIGSKYLNEFKMIVLGALILTLSLYLVLLIRERFLFMLILPFIGISIGLIVPNVLMCISKKAASTEQGRVLSLFSALRTLGYAALFFMNFLIIAWRPEWDALPLCLAFIFIFFGVIFLSKNR